MPLNYSKWDQLELSDDSDIEGHPNVDKKSLIRWKQRDIHEKREARNFRIQSLGAEIDCNEVLLARLRALLADLRSTDASMPPSKRFSNEVERLRTHPSPDAPPSAAQQPVSYDEMILRLLDAVAQESSAQKDKEGGVDAAIVKVLEGHVEKLAGVIEASRKEKEELEAEKRKHITMEDMREGWESKYVPATPAPVIPPPKKKKSTKTKETTIEVLNAPSSSTSATAAAAADEESEDEREPLPEMTGDLEEFSRIPLWDFERSWTFIQNHRSVVAPRSADALTVAAFEREGRGEKKLAKQAVHQSLLLQYGEKLGKDGIKLFFQRMIQGGEKARQVFAHDVEATYAHVEGRIKMTQAEAESAEPAEQIQLVAEHPGVEISFNVPDGPPPEHIVLEGPGTENLDIEEVRKALQLRWDVFEGLAEDMREALKSGELDRVNAVLGAMPVAEAEQVVQMLDVGGILSFAEGGIRDATREDAEGDEGAFEDAVEGASGVVEQVEETKKAAA